MHGQYPAFALTHSFCSSSLEVVGFPVGSFGKESAFKAGDPGSIPELVRSPGEGTGNPLQYSGLENSMDYIELDTTCHFTLVILDIRPGPGAQSCPTLCNPMDWSLPGSSVHGTLQASILEWVASPFSRGSSQPIDQMQVSHIAGGFFTV